MKRVITLILIIVGLLGLALFAQTPGQQQPPAGERGQRGQRGGRGEGRGAQQPARGPQKLAWVDRTGKVLGTIGQPQATILDPAISPDGKKIAVRGRDKQGDTEFVWIHDATTKHRLTTNPDGSSERHVYWSPKGDRIAFSMQLPGTMVSNLYIRAADGSGTDQLLVGGEGMHKWCPTWSPDGKTIVYHNNDLTTMARDIMFVDLASKKPEYLVQTPATEALPRFSMDGKFVAYQAQEEGGKFEVWVTTFPKSDKKWKVSTNGGIWPRWDKDEIFFWEGNAMMAVKFTARNGNFTASAPQKLFTSGQVGMSETAPSGYNFFYDYRDGKFVVVQQGPLLSTTPGQ
jgi:Tol biopolymer transport system component